MADIEEAVYSRLTTVATTSTVTSSTTIGAYPTLIADSSTATPYLIYLKSGGEHTKSFTGMRGIAEARFDILCVTSGTSAYKNAKILRDKVRAGIDGFSGTVAGVNIRAVLIDDENDEPNYAVGADEQRRQAVSLSTRWFYFEATT